MIIDKDKGSRGGGERDVIVARGWLWLWRWFCEIWNIQVESSKSGHSLFGVYVVGVWCDFDWNVRE